jgi:hypothetical protein
MFLTGGLVLVFISIIFTKGLGLLSPDKPFQGYTLGQALIVIGGFLVLAFWQLYVNQAFFGVTLASYT